VAGVLENVAVPRSRRTGGRSNRVRVAVLEATVDVLGESGFDTLSIREIAKRAGVHETSIYRRWGTRANLAVDALLSRSGLEIPTPDTGSLREDLLGLLRALAAFISTPLGENLVRIALRRDLPNSDATREKFWSDRFTRASVILDRAEARGELRSNVDRFLTLETLVAPLYLRLLLTREPVGDSVLESVVDLVLSGIAVERA
jgi:AcrR family transcriptional regulator